MNLVRKMTILIFVFLFCCPPVGVFAAKVSPLDVSDVMEDLEGLKLGDFAFNSDTYLSRTDGAPELLGMYEYGFGTDIYSLYFYIYVPDRYFGDNGNDYITEIRGFYGNINVFKDTKDNQPISMYVRFTIIDTSEDGHFFKCKVDPETYDISRFASFLIGTESRIYLPELYMDGDDIPQTADPYGGYDPIYFFVPLCGIKYFTFTTTGSATIEASEIIELDVKPSMYKTDFSPKGNYWHQMIYTAYFTIPKKYVENYDALTGIEATWEEYHTAPLVVTEDDALLSIFNTMIGDSNFQDKLSSGSFYNTYGAIISNYKYDANTLGVINYSGDRSINLYDIYGIHRKGIFPSGFLYNEKYDFSSDRFTRFDTALKVSDMDDFFIPTIGRYYDTDGDGIGDLAATFQNSVDEGRLLGENTYSYTSKDVLNVKNRYDSNWEKFWNGDLFNGEDVKVDLPPFYYLKDSDMTGYSRTEVNENLYIGERFWADFYDEYAKAKLTGDQVVLFRFALRDYYSAPARYVDGETYSAMTSKANCALSYGTAFLDFDIIKLTFSDDGESYTFDVKADPIDFVPGGANPNTPGGGIGDAADDLLSKILAVIETFFKIIVGIVAVVVVVTLIKWLLTWLALRRR